MAKSPICSTPCIFSGSRMCGPHLGIVLQLLADLLDELAHLLEVGVVGHADRDLVDHPVAAHVLHRAELAERHGGDGSAMVPQLDRAQREGLHRALVAPGLDVFADAEGIVEQVEDAGDDVLHQRLRAEADGDADDAGAGQQRADLDADRRPAPSAPSPRAMSTSRKLRRIGSSVRSRWRLRALGRVVVRDGGAARRRAGRRSARGSAARRHRPPAARSRCAPAPARRA